MRLSLRIFAAFAATFACTAGVAQASLGSLGPDAPLSLLLGVPLLLWVVSFTGLKHGLAWARRPQAEARTPIPSGVSLATHA